MARRANPAAGATATAEHEEQTPMEGGSAGIPAEPHKASFIPGEATATSARAPDPEAPPSPTVNRYMVENAGHMGKHVLMNGYKSLFKDGKVVDDLNYDIEALRQQGVKLRPIE